MTRNLIDTITTLVASPVVLDPRTAAQLLLHVEDTMAVAAAGWDEPLTRRLRKVYPGADTLDLSGLGGRAPDAAALVMATAGHALDYDDVHLEAVTHPSVVILPTLFALGTDAAAGRLLPAFAIGLAVTTMLGEVLDYSHYSAGWHATSTIGPIAAAAAGCHLLGLDADQTRHALSIAAAQAGGMQRNFGSDAKPLQAGFAAAAATRAVQLAQSGMTGGADPFGARGFLDLYAPDRAGTQWTAPDVNGGGISVKLYPCCYAAHRMVAAAIEAHAAIGAPAAQARIEITVPEGQLAPLTIADPLTGLEGKFCGAYTVAAALLQGTLGLRDFQDDAVRRPQIHDLMDRITIREEPGSAQQGAGIAHGSVVLEVQQDGMISTRAEVRHYPGSPQRPPEAAEHAAKLADCLAIYARHHDDAPDVDGLRRIIRRRCGQQLKATA